MIYYLYPVLYSGFLYNVEYKKWYNKMTFVIAIKLILTYHFRNLNSAKVWSNFRHFSDWSKIIQATCKLVSNVVICINIVALAGKLKSASAVENSQSVKLPVTTAVIKCFQNISQQNINVKIKSHLKPARCLHET